MITLTFDEFKDKFDRDFTFSETLPDIREKDFNNALTDALSVFNQDLIPVADANKNALLHLTAHFLVKNIDRADSGAQTPILQNSRSVGSMSESLQIPDWIANNAEFSYYATSSYGLDFLIICSPYLGGAIFSVAGSTQP